MEIQIQEIEHCKLAIQYTADAEEILNKRGQVLQQFKNAPVSGFRKGKATLDAIKMQYRDQIEDALKRALAEDAFHNTLFEKKLKPHGPPRFKAMLLDNGKFMCEFDLHTKPEFTLSPFNDMQVPKPHSNTVSEITEKMLQDLRSKFGETVPYSDTDFIQTGDNVIIDYEGSIDGELVPNLCTTGDILTVGTTNLNNFDDNILGMSIGETREFDLHIPESSLPSLSGKTAHMKVTLTMGSKLVPCPLDDTLAEKLGKKDMQELRMFVGGTAQATIQNNIRQSINDSVALQLVEKNDVKVPHWMSLSEAQYLVHNAKLDWNQLPNSDKEGYIKLAEKNVKLSLILDKIREENVEAQLTDQEVFEVVKQNLAKTKTDKPINEVIDYMNKTGILQILFARIKDEHTMDFVTKTVQIIE